MPTTPSTAKNRARGFVLGLALCGACLPAVAAPAAGPGADFFTNGPLHRFEIQLDGESLEGLRATPRKYRPATVRADGQTYTNVGVHLKGVATFRPVDGQPSLTLNFDKFVPGQRFHGLRKIHLNNSLEDPTFLCEAISAELFAQAGLPVARVGHARMSLNGRDLGPYVVIEGFTPEFLGRYFQNTGGNLYDSGFRRDVTEPLEKLLGKKPEDRADLKELVAAAGTPDLEQRWRQLARRLDTNNFARYLAMQVLTANWDGYAMFKNNYRIYHDPASDRLIFIPHGMDQVFARPRIELLPPWEGLVARAFTATRPGRALYEQEVGLLFTNVYHTPTLLRRVDELAARIRPVFVERGEPAAAAQDQRVAELRRRIVWRGEFLAQQLAATNWTNPPREMPPRRRPVQVPPPR